MKNSTTIFSADLSNSQLLLTLRKPPNAMAIKPMKWQKIGRGVKELELFKRTFNCHYDEYAILRSTVWRYRFIFFSLGILFIYLGIYTFTHGISFSSLLFGGLRDALHNFFAIVALTFAVGSIAVGYSLSIVREATVQITEINKRHALIIYQKRVAESAANFEQLRQKYCALLLQIDAQQEATRQVLRTIDSEMTLDCQLRESLFNQALAEQHLTLQEQIAKFNRFEPF